MHRCWDTALRAQDLWSEIEREPKTFEQILHACGQRGQAVAEFDWASTPLGPISGWGPALRNTVATMMASAQPMALWYGPELTTIFNHGFAPLLGQRAETALGQPLHVVWHDVWSDIRPLVKIALSGETVWREELPLTLTRNGYEEQTYWTFSYSPLYDDDGRVAGFLDVVTETTEAVILRKQMAEANRSLAAEIENARTAIGAQQAAEAEQQVLRSELVHRIKNLLAIVQAIVSQSIRSATSIEAAQESVSARLAAFGRAQDLLTSEGGSQARLRQVIDAALSPYHTSERFHYDGPEVFINAQQSLGISLALHELATNATKYGALHHPQGSVRLSWGLEEDHFTFCWKETGVSLPVAPVRRGFGSRLAEQIVAGYFSGEAKTDYEADGIAYRLSGRLMPEKSAGP